MDKNNTDNFKDDMSSLNNSNSFDFKKFQEEASK